MCHFWRITINNEFKITLRYESKYDHCGEKTTETTIDYIKLEDIIEEIRAFLISIGYHKNSVDEYFTDE